MNKEIIKKNKKGVRIPPKIDKSVPLPYRVHGLRKITKPNQIQKLWDAYLNECFPVFVDENNVSYRKLFRPLTVVGFCHFCAIDYATLIRLQNDPKFTQIVKNIRQNIETFAAEQLFTNKNQVSMIFNLKVNHGWKDIQHIEFQNKTKFEFDDGEPASNTPQITE